MKSMIKSTIVLCDQHTTVLGKEEVKNFSYTLTEDKHLEKNLPKDIKDRTINKPSLMSSTTCHMIFQKDIITTK